MNLKLCDTGLLYWNSPVNDKLQTQMEIDLERGLRHEVIMNILQKRPVTRSFGVFFGLHLKKTVE